MLKKSIGIHHITAIVGNPQENIDFYTHVLGLRLVKKTVNFDDPYTYHLYFGDKEGKPGTTITFFPWSKSRKGTIGGGQVSITSYVVPVGAMDFWTNRLEEFNIPYVKNQRFGEEYIQFQDPHGLQLEIVSREEGEKNDWEYAGITSNEAIKGFGGATLLSLFPEKTSYLLENVLGLKKIGKELDVIRYKSVGSIGNVIDLKTTPVGVGHMGIGTVHHIALRAKDDEDQLEWINILEDYRYYVSPIRDRNYFKSIYFREKGGNLFEIATDEPGFTIDEPLDQLGQSLKLPPQYEANREDIEKGLMPVKVKEF
ncbi:ring-cleaving dioxygenase [Clostridium sp. Cult2]|uniref:ring-cleaving dioxygenase n=1 Tax=Clostridium sp. Cult2 TaxID=2079003 RepID=UPI001F227999|nr:ring-cleaving dioxygenase [Clostridium sp. Cult2]MCF6466200.1 ring-cleaving dioxygenase [Clostridium sp. Cult2]